MVFIKSLINKTVRLWNRICESYPGNLKIMIEIIKLKDDAVKVVKITGELDKTNFEKLKGELSDLAPFSEVLIDLTEVTIISSDFLNFLAILRNRRPLDHKKIRLLNPNDLVSRMVEMSHLESVYRIERIFPTAW